MIVLRLRIRSGQCRVRARVKVLKDVRVRLRVWSFLLLGGRWGVLGPSYINREILAHFFNFFNK